MPVGRERFDRVVLPHDKEADGVAQRIRLVETVLRSVSAARCIVLINPNKFNVWIAEQVFRESERLGTRQTARLTQWHKFRQHITPGITRAPIQRA